MKILFWITGILLWGSFPVAAQGLYQNPIVRGGYPDPSICRVGDTFYLVNSSFEYFPGLPIHASTDLVNWELIGYGLHRTEQCTNRVNLTDIQSDGGIHAPTIRYHNGTFYIITTNVYYDEATKTTDFVNFIITAKDAAGPWSDPHVLEGAPGIDPDIFFDSDGTVWYTGTQMPEEPNFQGEGEIWMQQIDIDNWALTGKRHLLWRGACGGVWAEGPHIYKHNGRYYLMIAEGGTSFNHAVMIAVSDSITGPYIPNDRNPILSTRHLSYDYWVNSTGHGDLIALADGRWYMVALGIRGDLHRKSNMGRETHLIPVSWEQEPFLWKQPRYDWPVVSPLTGRVEREYPLPFDRLPQRMDTLFSDSFNRASLDLAWQFRRVPDASRYSLEERAGYLRLYSADTDIDHRHQYAFVGIPQTESDFTYRVHMDFAATQDSARAGIAMIQKDDTYITFTIAYRNHTPHLQLTTKQRLSPPQVVMSQPLPAFKGSITLKVTSDANTYSFSYALADGLSHHFAETPADILLSEGYTGAYLGLYVYDGVSGSSTYADFDGVQYVVHPR